MPKCVIVRCDGSVNIVDMLQTKASEFMKGALTFVGAVPDLNVYALARQSDVNVSASEAHFLVRRHGEPLFFESNVCGDILFVASDEDGDETDVDVEALKCCLLCAS